jgi:quercetin dioxygenase-like cupin family protein
MIDKIREFKFGQENWRVENNESYEVVPGVWCDNYEIVDDGERDLAVVSMEPDTSTPRQLVKTGEETVEVFTGGSGKLVVEDVNGETHEHEFEAGFEGEYVTVAIGEKMQWIAGEEGLQFTEICVPPYEDGRFENINDKNEWEV